jgi:cholesterol transport system auxiliary component
MKPRILETIAAVAGVTWLCGCSTASLFDSETPIPTNYVLAAAPPAKAPTPSRASNVDLAIARPDVIPGLDSRRIAVLKGRLLDHYKGTEWGGSVTEVVQTLLVGSLDQQQLFRSVTSEQTRVSADYILDVEVRDFQSEYAEGDAGGSPQVRVTFISRLIRIKDRELIATLVSTALKPAADNRMGAVAAAFESAAQQAALDLAGKAASAVATDVDKNPVSAEPRKG